MKISSILRDLLTRRAERTDAVADAWIQDPYAHPDIDAMCERERADLPPVHMPAPPASVGLGFGSPNCT